MDKNSPQKIQQINNALSSAVSSINLAKNLLKELFPETFAQAGLEVNVIDTIPGTIGKFVGDHMETEKNEKIEVPANYASKSTLVYGDKLKMYEEGGEKKFKQVERVKRFRIEGIVAKKEGKWCVVTSDSSYRVLDASIEHFGAKEGDTVVILLPLDNKYAPFAALESMPGKNLPVASIQPVVAEAPKVPARVVTRVMVPAPSSQPRRRKSNVVTAVKAKEPITAQPIEPFQNGGTNVDPSRVLTDEDLR